MNASPRHGFGFTLIELMVTLAIVAILASIAAPSFQSLIAGQRVRGAASDLASALTLTRSEAIKRNVNATLTSAAGTDWESGWSITAASTTVLTQAPLRGVIIGASATTVTYNRSGRLNSADPVSFEVADATAASTVAPRCVSIGVTGQAITKAGGC